MLFCVTTVAESGTEPILNMGMAPIFNTNTATTLGPSVERGDVESENVCPINPKKKPVPGVKKFFA